MCMIIYSTIITLSWLTFIVYWLYSSFGVKRTTGRSGARGLSSPLFRIVLALLIVVFVSLPPVNNFFVTVNMSLAPYFQTTMVEALGALICVLGVAFAIWARVNLGKNWGMPMTLKENRELVTSGPYMYVRHPIYTGMLGAFFGTAIVNGIFWLLPLIIFFIYFVYSARVEEGIMTREFPTEYPAYKARTKMLIPFIF
jgi:protein-S-isoprenylcysteine O-methyltransferase Ste14